MPDFSSFSQVTHIVSVFLFCPIFLLAIHYKKHGMLLLRIYHLKKKSNEIESYPGKMLL